MRGRRRKPTAVHEANGNPGKRALNKREPKFAVGAPPIPSDVLLDVLEKQIWRLEVPRLVKKKIITEADGLCLARYCCLKARLIRNRKEQQSLGWPQTVLDFNAIPKKHPLILIENDTLKELRQVESELGLTPASRARLQVPIDEPEADPLDEFDTPAPGGAAGRVVSIGSARAR
jgi:P27 family predicted phage terminase small subunit